MQVCPTEADWALAREVHGFFAPKPGARHIASEFALAYLHTLLNDSHAKHVLEFGAGIGTITTCLLSHPSRPILTSATFITTWSWSTACSRASEHYEVITLGTICFVEGSRTPTRLAINEKLAGRNLVCPFVNFNRGTRYFHFSMRESKKMARLPAGRTARAISPWPS